MICRCGPRSSARVFAADAVRVRSKRSDPTGTLPLQKRFQRELVSRWDTLRRTVPNFVTARTDLSTTIGHAAITGQDPVRAFQKWFDTALKMVVVGDGRWMARFVREAGDSALLRINTTPKVDRVPPLQTLAHTELQGIAEAVSQQAVRAYANGLLTRATPSQIARDVQAIIDKIGKQRSELLISFIIVRTFSAVTLDTFRAAGLTHVGIDAERVTPSLVQDAKKKVKKKKRPFDPEGLIEVLTAGDDDVCPECEQISEEGPYTLDEAEDLIPAHPRCRCAFVPWGDERYASVRDAVVNVWDEFHPDQPRDYHGRWAEGYSSTPAQDLLTQHHTGDETMADVERQMTPEQKSAMQEAELALAGQKPTSVTMLGPDGKYTAERSALHADILGKMFTTQKVANAMPPDGKRPVLTITGGRPASGKTTTLKDELADINNKSFYISADEIQESLPGYNGKNAGIYNGEAQDIALQAESIARARRMNITYDATLKSQTPAVERVKQYQHAGYEVHGYFVHTAPVTSAVRSVERFMRSGRYVPAAIAFNSRTNEKTFDTLTPMLDRWAIFDNNGDKPKLIARGRKH